MPKAFDILGERLLQAGIGDAHIRRYLAELRDHRDDLVAEAQASGRSPADAHCHAMQRLGDTEALAAGMIERREFQAWSARAPVAAYVVGPPVILTLVTALWVAALVATCTWLRHSSELSDLPAWIGGAADGAARLSNTTLSILLGWVLAASALRRRAPVLWPMLGLLALAALGAALQIDITLPAGGAHGEVDLRPAFGRSPLDPSSYWGRFVLDLAATTLPYGLLSHWRAAPAAAARL